jgi:predicted nucleic acid-binding protein
VAYVLDTSAVLAVLKAEPGYEKVAEILAEAESDAGQDILLPFMAVMETQYRLLRDLPQEEVLAAVRLVEAWPVTVMESTPSWRQRAAEVKSRGGLSVADAWIASLALLHDAELVHKDPEFDNVEGLRSYRLPD